MLISHEISSTSLSISKMQDVPFLVQILQISLSLTILKDFYKNEQILLLISIQPNKQACDRLKDVTAKTP